MTRSKSINHHYVYVYTSPEDGRPVYVGKGWGDRAWSHIDIAARNPEQHRNKYFARTLAKWLRDGLSVEPEILATFDTHEQALDREVELIRQYGRHNLKTGTLLNLTDGGEGTAGRGQQIEVGAVAYPTIREACLRYGLAEGTVRNRMGIHGYTVRQAFGIDPPPKYVASGSKPIKVAGQQFASVAAACEHFRLTQDVVSARLTRTDWTPEQVFGLDPPPYRHGPNAVPVCVGEREFPSLSEACRILAPGLKPDTIKARIHPKGWTIEQAFEIEPPPKKVGGPQNPVVAFGHSFRSLSEAARAHGLHKDTVAWRLRKQGMTLEQALSERASTEYRVGEKTFRTFSEACDYFGHSRALVNWRLKSGWTVEDAFKVPARTKKLSV